MLARAFSLFAFFIVGCGSTTALPSGTASNASTKPAPSPSSAHSASVASIDPPHAVAFEVRRTTFAPGDDLHIDTILSDRDDFTEGGSYVVRGRYTLQSHPRASLALFSTGGESSVTPERVVVDAGNGAFEFRVVVRRAGYLRISFAPPEGGDGFGSATFGRGAPAYRKRGEIASPAPSSSAPSMHLPPTDERPVE